MPEAAIQLGPLLRSDNTMTEARLKSGSHQRPPGAAQASSPSAQRTVPEEVTELGTGGGEGSKVFLFNCECHTFEDVITQLLKAVPGMTRALAEELAWRVHTQGLAEVYRGSAAECDRVAKVLGETGLIVQVL